MTEFLHRAGVPSGWHLGIVALAAMVALAALDFLGAVAAKEWSLARHPAWLVAGFACFGLLFLVYGASLSYAELSVVTFGWVVFLQVGILLYERVRYGVQLPPDKTAAMVAILLLQAYLILRPTAPTAETGAVAAAPTAPMGPVGAGEFAAVAQTAAVPPVLAGER